MKPLLIISTEKIYMIGEAEINELDQNFILHSHLRQFLKF